MNASTAKGCSDASAGESSQMAGMEGEMETDDACERNEVISRGEMRENW